MRIESLKQPSAGLRAARPPLIRKIQLFVYIHFPHSDYFINCPAFISSLPIPPNNQFFYPDQQTHHRSFVDSKDLLSLLKEPLFFDDWAAANFKAINLPSDWLAAQQSPYQILGGDPEALRLRAGRASGVRPGARAGRAPVHRAGAGEGRGGPSGRPWGLHASAAPCSAAHRRPTVAMAAVAVLRNDSLQAFLQVRAGLGGGEGKVGRVGSRFLQALCVPGVSKGAVPRGCRWSQT